MADGAASKVTSDDVRAALRLRFEPGQFALLWEVANGTGANARRFADAIAFGLWPSHGCKIEGIEIKVSRSDFLHEMKQPEKSTPIYQHCHHWWLACPAGMVSPDELPPTWGLLELLENGTLRAKRKAPLLEPVDMPRSFVAALLRRHAGLDEELTKREVEKRCAAIEQFADERVRRDVEQRVSERVKGCEEGLAKLARIRDETGLDFLRRDTWTGGIDPARFIAAVKLVQALGIDYSAPLAEMRKEAERVAKLISESGLVPASEVACGT